MTPLEIEILLHYHTHGFEYHRHNSVPSSTWLSLREKGFLVKEDDYLQATEKLHVFCEALCRVPEPVQQWVVPSKDKKERKK